MNTPNSWDNHATGSPEHHIPSGMHLPIPIAFAVQKVIDQTLPLDPDMQRALGSIDGSVILIKIRKPAIEFALSIADNDIQLIRVFDGEADATFSAYISDYIDMQTKESVIDNGRFWINGDRELATKFSDIVYRSDVDWQDALAPFLGETVVQKMGELAKRLGLWAGSTKEHLKEDTAEYLQEETDMLVSKNQVGSFEKRLNSAAEQVDALDKKIDALEQKAQRS